MTLFQIGLSLSMTIVPLAYLVGAYYTQSNPIHYAKSHWSATVALGASLTSALVALTGVWFGAETRPLPWLSPAPVSLVLLLLIGFIGLIIARYSGQYLAGERRQRHYHRSLQLTLAAVTLVVVSNHLLILLGGWVAISLSLHQLLMFYPERPRAALAAHKKFLFARLAELSLLAAVVLLYAEHGTWHIDQIVAAYPVAQLSNLEQLAALLLALTALIKCAQLPLHGWLMQVVEAPTPVSALLHAGIINLGGYLLILFSPLLVQASTAQWLLLVVAGLTTLLAGLSMMTRISIKVKLAWSTCAQMGVMLVEIALGLFELALLHLVAHSCYKAYAFLNAGSAVEAHSYARLAPARRPGLLAWLSAALLSSAAVTALIDYLDLTAPLSPWLLLAVTLTLLLAERMSRRHAGSLLSVAVLAAILVAAYSLQKAGAGWFAQSILPSVGWLGDAWIGLVVVLLFAGYLVLRYAPSSDLGRRLWRQLYAGLYLDEWVTRTTLWVWPTRLPARVNAKQLSQPLRNQDIQSWAP